jgi:hypothetical protein
MLPVRFEEQILPGTFEYTLNRLIDESIDLTVFEARYRNTAICKDSRRCASNGMDSSSPTNRHRVPDWRCVVTSQE